ncbi:hypothetical protein D3C78_948960 [compost metagenome]
MPAVAQRQVAHQQGIPGLELAADDVRGCFRQLQAFGVFDLVAAQGCQLPANAAEDVPVGNEVGLPVEGVGAAGVEVGEAFLEQLELVLVVAGLGAVIQFLQQHQVWLLVADDPRYLIEAEGHVLRCRFFVTALGQVIPEHITFTGQVLNVPGHHLQGLAGDQGGRLGAATDFQCFLGLGAPGQAVEQRQQQAGERQQAQQGVAQ